MHAAAAGPGKGLQHLHFPLPSILLLRSVYPPDIFCYVSVCQMHPPERFSNHLRRSNQPPQPLYSTALFLYDLFIWNYTTLIPVSDFDPSNLSLDGSYMRAGPWVLPTLVASPEPRREPGTQSTLHIQQTDGTCLSYFYTEASPHHEQKCCWPLGC